MVDGSSRLEVGNNKEPQPDIPFCSSFPMAYVREAAGVASRFLSRSHCRLSVTFKIITVKYGRNPPPHPKVEKANDIDRHSDILSTIA